MGFSLTYPQLLVELQKGLKESDQLFNQADTSSQESITSYLEQIFRYIQENNQNLKNMSLEDQNIQNDLKVRLKDIQSLDQYIIQIKDDSSAMELISLNAMTVALKAGNNGRAFSFITEELKRLSGRTMELTDRLMGRGRTVLGQFEKFHSTIELLKEQESTKISSFEEQFKSAIVQINISMEDLDSLMKQNGGLGQAITKELKSLISAVQTQDLIRQSIDHVIISLKELDVVPQGNSSTEETLDMLSFHEQLPQLCIAVLDEVRTLNNNAHKAFDQHLQEIDALIQELLKVQSNITNKTSSGEASGIQKRLDESMHLFYTLSSDLGELMKAKSQSVNASKDLETQVRDLDEDFRSFESLITRFQTVDIASRIEIAKQQILREMSGTVDQMTDLTARIKSDVDSAIGITGTFLNETKKLLQTYRDYQHQRSQVTQQFIQGVEVRTKRFAKIQDSLLHSFINSEEQSRKFVEAFRGTSGDLSALKHLDAAIAEQQDNLRSLQKAISAEKKKLMAAENIRDWNIHNHKLNEMIQRFTIFTHKEAAAKLGGFQVETGLDAGEVTLF